jgi:tetratricopeptide (TPR) repeat protein
VPARIVITVRRAAAVAAIVAVLVYLTALGNGFALDDEMIVQLNPAAHSVGAALGAFDQPYWPPQHGAGTYRPLAILSFAADWQFSGGSTLWLHAVNVAWHAAATALLVPILAVYVGPAGALAGGVVFAVHPVHVEAVANLVGRSELLVATFLFAALLLARRVRRRRAAGRGTLAAEAAVLVTVALGLLSKEHAVVAVALLALDDLGTRETVGPHLPWRTYAAVAVLTAGWFVGWRIVQGDIAFATIAPTFLSLGAVGRISTMLPVVFVLLRLLVWPLDLSPDYHPRVIERLEHPNLEGAAGAIVLLAAVLLAFALWRRNRGIAVALFIVGIAWLPTSNLLFPSGVVIAERTLYLASAGAALAAGAGAAWMLRRLGGARAAALLGVVLLVFSAQTVAAIPTWRSNRDLVLRALIAHPESYRVHEAAGRVLVKLGDMPRALAEYGISVELYPLEVPNLLEAARVAADAGNARLAGRYLDQAERVGLRGELVEWVRAYVLMRTGSASAALEHAHRAVEAAPTDAQAARILTAAFLALDQPDSARAVWPAFRRRGGSPYLGWLYGSSTFAAVRMLDSARMAFDSAAVHSPGDPNARADLGRLRALIGGLAEAAPSLR